MNNLNISLLNAKQAPSEIPANGVDIGGYPPTKKPHISEA
jgi:hypothetical protein